MRWSVRALKRSMDVVASFIGLTLVAPLFPIVALIVYLDSPGPVFFRQRRAGRLLGPGKDPLKPFEFVEFNMYKFRSMRNDAEKFTGAVIASQNDPRITRIGRFLRKSRIDELPQLWNVLRGDMSLVGPRPERPELLSNLALAIPFFEERMRDVKPGITGLAQVSLGYSGSVIAGSDVEALSGALQNPFGLEDAEGAEADDMRMKLLYDLAYVAALEGMGSYLRMELSVLVRTPVVMLKGLGR